MDYSMLDQQYNQLQQQTQNNLQTLQQVAGRVTAMAPDVMTGREINMELRSLAMSLQQQQQNMGMLLQQMAQHIQQLEMQMQQSLGQSGVNPNMGQRPWNAPMQGMGGGFLGNVMTGLGLGAGFAVADNIVDDIFDSF